MDGSRRGILASRGFRLRCAAARRAGRLWHGTPRDRFVVISDDAIDLSIGLDSGDSEGSTRSALVGESVNLTASKASLKARPYTVANPKTWLLHEQHLAVRR